MMNEKEHVGVKIEEHGQDAHATHGQVEDSLRRNARATVRVHFGSARMTAAEIEQIEPGSVIEMDALAGEDVEVFVEGRFLARGQAVLVKSHDSQNEHVAVAVSEVAPVQSAQKRGCRPSSRTASAKAALAIILVAAMLSWPAMSLAQSAPSTTSIEKHQVDKGGNGNSTDLGYDSWTTFVQTLLALAVVIVLIYVCRWILRRVGKVGPMSTAAAPGAVAVISRTSAGNRQQLLLVRLGNRVVLVGSWPGGMAGLSEITDPAEVAALTAPGGSARAVADKIRERLDGKEEKK